MPAGATIPDVDVGERVFLFRDARGWSIVETAKRSGLSREAVGKIEGGKTSPTLASLRRLSRGFGVSLDEFLHGPVPERETEKQT
ncbi:MAG: helix-turn-helix domain-containing protein [Actinomycetota bacterium]|nr:helix-turn-helix domain-containing protein [Actinomycetota bacterium]